MNETMDTAGFEHCVRESAYYLWENEGRPFGRHVEHWLVCEGALQAERAEAATLNAAPAEASAAKPEAASVVAQSEIVAPEAPVAKPKKAATKAKAAAPRKAKAVTPVRRRPTLQEISATLQ